MSIREHLLTPRERLESWVLGLSCEAMTVDPIATDEAISALTGGRESFCPQPHSNERLHHFAAALLRIARL